MSPLIASGQRRSSERVRPGTSPTLAAVVAGAWEGLVAGRPVSCPACGGDMREMRGAKQTTGQCSRCGSQLL